MCGRITLLTYDELREVIEAVEGGKGALGRTIDSSRTRNQARPGNDVQALVPGSPHLFCHSEAEGRRISPGREAGDSSLALRMADNNRLPGSEDAGNREFSLSVSTLSWGFDTPWNKSLTFNTRIESALEGSRMWAEAIRNGRCILPAATFFEPHGSETVRSPRTGRPMKRQYEFSSPDGMPLLLASIQQNGRLSVVTTEPNADVSPIHKRMPLVLRFEELHTWISGNYASLADRSGFSLFASPEDKGRSEEPSQLSLF